MNFSLSTVINATIASSIFICIAVPLSYIGIANRRIKLYAVSFLCVMAVVRLFMPLEFFFTHSIYIKNLWYGLYSVLNNNYIHFFNIDMTYEHVLFSLWSTGTLCKLAHTLYKYKKSMDSINLLPRTSDPCAVQALEKCNVRFRHFAPVRLFTASHISSPFITGILSPVIVIPDIRLSEKEWEYIFIHELSHYYKGHLLFQFLMEILAALYFWNPLLLILNRHLPRLYEFDADEEVCTSLDGLQKIDYSHCLLKMLRLQAKQPAVHTPGISFASSDLDTRIKRTLDTRQSSGTARLNHMLLIGTVLLFILSYTIILEPTHSPSDDPDTIGASELYCRPNEDGAYDYYSIYNDEYCFTANQILDEQILIKEDSNI